MKADTLYNLPAGAEVNIIPVVQGEDLKEISDAELDAYLSMPDCPQCGSDDVVCTDSYPDGFGNIVKVYYCNKCGHSWAEVE